MQDPYLHIEGYINGTLSDDDKVAFEFAMANDSKLREAVEDFDLVSLIGEALLEEEITSIVSEEISTVSSERPFIKRMRPWLAAASVVVGLIIVNYYFVNKENYHERQQRYVSAFDYYTPPHNIVRGDNSTGATSIEKIQRAFDKKQYSEAERLLSNIDIGNDHIQQEQVMWYKAHIAFRQQKFTKSLKYLSGINKSSSLYIEAIKLRTLIYYINANHEMLDRMCTSHIELKEICEVLTN